MLREEIRFTSSLLTKQENTTAQSSEFKFLLTVSSKHTLTANGAFSFMANRANC